ncbi:MAG: stage II sporulation protein M [Owenweeksia sp.]
MNEAAFIKANIKKWEEFEQWLEVNTGRDPDELASQFIQLTDDLAYAQTHYPNGDITVYLNGLTSKVYQYIYRNKKESAGRFKSFWKYELPEIAYHYRRYLLYSFLFFGVAFIIGAVSMAHDDNFARLIMGDAYVNMTEENVASGDPMAVYKKMGRTDMFFAITFNNVRVSLICFAAGILFSAGTVFALFTNGVMLGAFQFWFYQKGLLLTSALTIWIHGTLEISAIIISGAAGLIMGNSLLFPGTYSRMDSLRKGALDGIKLVMGLVPIFIVAGFLESFITRLTEWPDIAKIAIIASSAFFILYYFIIYPNRLAKNAELTQN